MDRSPGRRADGVVPAVPGDLPDHTDTGAYLRCALVCDQRRAKALDGCISPAPPGLWAAGRPGAARRPRAGLHWRRGAADAGGERAGRRTWRSTALYARAACDAARRPGADKRPAADRVPGYFDATGLVALAAQLAPARAGAGGSSAVSPDKRAAVWADRRYVCGEPNGRRTTDDGRRTTDDGRRTTDDGRRTTIGE